MDVRINVVKQHPLARLPVKDTEGSAGHSLTSVDDYTIYPDQRVTIDTGLIMDIPRGLYGRIADRSGLASKYGIHVLGGVVDSDYRGVVGVTLLNTGEKEFHVRAGFKIGN